MYIVHVASEFAPIAKVGGLADVVYGLAKEQVRLGHRVEIILPKYDIIDYKKLSHFSLELGDLWSFEDTSRYHNAVFSGYVDGIKVHLIEPHHNHYYFNRGKIYGLSDDSERFLYFSRTAGEFLHVQKERPDIIHLHDWPTATLAPILKHIYCNLGFSYGGIVLTIHNIEHQGKCFPANLSRIGLRGEDFRREDRLQDPENPSLLNLLKGGIVYADAVTTVSNTYAQEIKSSFLGFGLDEIIRNHTHRITGIRNGIDLNAWNPSSDPYLPVTYPTNSTFIDTITQNKEINKELLFQKLNMQPVDGPLIVSISRLSKQKGPRLILHAISYTLRHESAFILLGSSIDSEYEQEFYQLEHTYRANPHSTIKLSFDEPLSHLLYAAADAIFIPSLFEPCGLTQMIGMRYGTIAIARKTGGLADTIFDADDPKIPLTQRNGFLFENPDNTSAEKALKRAIHCFRNDKKRWRQLIQNALNQDVSWSHSASLYTEVYNDTLKKNKNPKAA